MESSELIRQHLCLVGPIANQMATGFPRHVDRQDLARAGTLGLVEAAGRFDPDRGVPFGRFAAARIRGAILDTVRSVDWAPRSLRRSARRLQRAEQHLTAEYGRAPTPMELAAELTTSPGAIAELRAGIARATVLALDGHGASTDDDPVDTALVDRTAPEPGEAFERTELVDLLRQAVRRLPERQRAVVVGYFIDGRTSQELAAEMGVTESRVSQLRTQAIATLRGDIEARYADTVSGEAVVVPITATPPRTPQL
jgi:RNA polymerase sigma factor for flagellar operon FliA